MTPKDTNIGFEIVGDQLYEKAREETDERRKNLFIRSAINRYYYAAYQAKIKVRGYLCRSLRETYGKDYVKQNHGLQIKPAHKPILKNKSQSKKLYNQIVLEQLDKFDDFFEKAHPYRLEADYSPDSNFVLDTTSNMEIIKIINPTKTKDPIRFEEVREWPESARDYAEKIIDAIKKGLKEEVSDTPSH